MPRRLPARWQPESIHEFRASAQQRFEDGTALAASGRRTGAIYLWGYSAEMTLKAAYFSLTGLAQTDVITVAGHIMPSVDRGRRLFRIAWRRPEGHDVAGWTELLIAERAAMPGAAYPALFGREVLECGQSIGQLWSETLRYHKNVAYLFEVAQVRQAAEWFLLNSPAL